MISFTSSHSKPSEGSVIRFAHVAAHMRHSRLVAAPRGACGGNGLARVQAISATIETPESGRCRRTMP